MSLRELLLLMFSLLELTVSAVVHFVYAVSILSSAVVADFLDFCTRRPFRCVRVHPVVGDGGKQSIVTSDGEGRQQDLIDGLFFEGREEVPIVLVHGIFGFGKGKMGGLSYWAGAEKKDEGVLAPDLGPLTSIYDRARELFYYLKGGTVDYGVDHSSQHGHSRFGRVYAHGHYPKWDENHPIHFVGHSTGAQVVRVLQQMLADKKFEGHENTSADWVISLTSLSGVLNGSTRIYLDGIRPEDGWTINSISLLQLLRLGVVVYEWLDIPLLKRYYSFGFDHYNLSWRKSGFVGLVKGLLNQSGPFASGDWICPDLSVQSTVQVNKTLNTHPNTYYFSYATQRTRKLFGYTVPSSVVGIHPLLYIRALQMCQWRHPSHTPPPFEGYRDDEWKDNDGALNTISMLYPRFPEVHPNCLLGPDLNDGRSLQPGVWYYTVMEADHIFFIINRERAGIQFDMLYNSIFQRCRKQMIKVANQKLQSLCTCTTNCMCQLSGFESEK